MYPQPLCSTYPGVTHDWLSKTRLDLIARSLCRYRNRQPPHYRNRPPLHEQCVVVCCSVLQTRLIHSTPRILQEEYGCLFRQMSRVCSGKWVVSARILQEETTAPWAVCCSALQCVTACCFVLQTRLICRHRQPPNGQWIAVCCSVVQRVADTTHS